MQKNNDLLNAAALEIATEEFNNSSNKLRSNLLITGDANPDQAAKQLQLARKTGIPASVVAGDQPAAQKQLAVFNADFDALVRTNPSLANMLADQQKMAVAHDDIRPLAATESAIKLMPANPDTRGWWDYAVDETLSVPGAIAKGLGGSFNETGAATNIVLGAFPTLYDKAAGLITGKPSTAASDWWFKNQVDPLIANRATFAPDENAGVVQKTALGAGQAVGMLSQIVLTGGSGGAVTGATSAEMLASGLVQAYKSMAAPAAVSGVNTAQQVYDKTGSGIQAANTGIARYNFDSLLGLTPLAAAGGLVARVATGAAAGAASEQAGRVGMNQILPESMQQEFNVSDFASSLILGGAMGGAMGERRAPSFTAETKATQAVAKEMQRMGEAEKDAQSLAALSEISAQSKLRERDPDTFKEHVQNVVDSGQLSEVYVDAEALNNALHQSGVTMEKLAETMPDVAEQMTEAQATQGMVRISLPDYATHIAGGPVDLALAPYIKARPEGATLNDFQEYNANLDANMQAHAEKIMSAKAEDEAFQADAQFIYDDVLAKLNAIGRNTNDHNQAYATMWRDFMVVNAERVSRSSNQPVKAGELYQQYNPKIVRDRMAGEDGFNQSDDLQALKNQFDAMGVTYGVNARDGIITLSKLIVPETERGSGKGTAAMKALLDYADQTGQHIALTPSADFGGNKKRLTDFYKRFGFVENKGKNKAYSVSEGMIRLSENGRVLYQSDTGASETAPRGAYMPETNTIALLKDANASTFLHESGHFFLDILHDLSALAPEIAADMGVALDWMGVKGGEGYTAADVWGNMSLEEKRAHHEKWAEGFESYLMTGKAPSLELQSVFSRFRAWLLNIYKSARNMQVEVSDDIKGVFDRMLASDTAIKEAESTREYAPLFKTAEEAGMSVEEFAAYKNLDQEATDEAIGEMSAKSLRDMKWLSGAKSRAMKELQAEAADRRAEIQREVTAQTMQEPIYQAWQWLSGRVDAMPDMPKGNKNPKVDASQDSLFTAIAKLGGLSREQLKSEWGTDPKDTFDSGEFGKPVVRAKGGKTIDDMAAMLGERGYLPVDENGKVDIADLEMLFGDEASGHKQYSNAVDPQILRELRGYVDEPAPIDLMNEPYGRLNRADVEALASSSNEQTAAAANELLLRKGKWLRADGASPDLLAEVMGFSSGDHLLRELVQTPEPKQEIKARTDAVMLARHGELVDPKSIERAAEAAIHNEARARFIATGLKALAKTKTSSEMLLKAADEAALAAIAAKKVADLRPAQYLAAEAKANKDAQRLVGKDPQAAIAAQRAALLNNRLARHAAEAQREVAKGVEYLVKLDKPSARKAIDVEYMDQIDNIIDGLDLRKSVSGRALEKRKSLAEWMSAQEEAGFVPDIPETLLRDLDRKHVKEMSVEEFRGVVDSIKQIEHLGRFKNKLLTAKDQREYAAIRDEMVNSIVSNAGDRQAYNRTEASNLGRFKTTMRNFWAAHIKSAMLARTMDGGKDGGAVWEYLIRPANAAGDFETTRNAAATVRLAEILDPVRKLGKMEGKGEYFPAIGRSLNRAQRLAIALNTGNEGNMQRLLGGEGWNRYQIEPVLQSLSKVEWDAVQAIWDHFETYRPEIAAKEKRIYGKEPQWIEAAPFTNQHGDYRGGYYPVKYDAMASFRAESHSDAEEAKRLLQGAYTSATTKRSFTKTRAEAVEGRPLAYTLDGVFGGVSEVIHDLAWHEWLIDANRLMRSGQIDAAMRDHYGAESKAQLKKWIADIAEGSAGTAHASDKALSRLRKGVSIAGLGFNVMSAAMQPLGMTQSIVRIGAKWAGRGIAKTISDPKVAIGFAEANSEFMANRSRTRFRELNELRGQVQDQSQLKDAMTRNAFWLMMRCQQLVDVPTWHGAYEKAMSEGVDEGRAFALADQAVLDAQGGGQLKDLSAIERGGPAQKLFTVFYSFMNTALNLGITQGMTAKSSGKLAADMAMLFIVPPLLGVMLKQALQPGGEDEWDMDKLAKTLAGEQLGYLTGMMFMVREFGEAGKTALGLTDYSRDYAGPAGVRAIGDAASMAKQAQQGEFDAAFTRSAINLLGSGFGFPAAQINKTIAGATALYEDETDNPAALVFGYKKQ